MSAVFADTFFYLALLDQRDPSHARALELSKCQRICVSFVVMQDEELTDALTGDCHFEQAGFRALLA